MSDCEALREDLKAYLDEELSLVRRQIVRRHLAGCASCQEEVRAMTSIGSALRETADAADGLDPALRARILAGWERIAPEPVARTGDPWPRRRALLSVCGAAASFALIFVILFPLFTTAREKARQVSTAAADRREAGARPASRVAEAPVATEPAAAPLEEKAADRMAMKATRSARPEPTAGAFPAAPSPPSNASAGASAKPEAAPEAVAAAPPSRPRRIALSRTRAAEKAEAGAPVERQADTPVETRADIAVEVADLDEKTGVVTKLARDAGGFVADTGRSDTAGDGARTALLTVRVPAARVEEVLGQIAGLGEASLRDKLARQERGAFSLPRDESPKEMEQQRGRQQKSPALATITVRLREKTARP